MKDNISNTITIKELCKKMWSRRKIYYWVLPITFVLACIWILPQPKRYKASVKLAPETVSNNSFGSFNSIASSLGINLGGISSEDAIYPSLYPELFTSPEFIDRIYNIQVVTPKDSIQTDYFTYLQKYQKKNWLLYPLQWVIKKGHNLIFPLPKSRIEGTPDDPFYMSYEKQEMIKELKHHLMCDVDKSTSVITITAIDQDAYIAAIVVDSIRHHLQNYITEYRTQKVRVDMIYYQQLEAEAEQEYALALAEYSRYIDAHNNVILQSEKVEEQRLEEKVAIKKQLYTTLTTQYQTTKIKVQEATPSFTTLRSTVVPNRPFAPQRRTFVMIMVLLAFICTSCYVLWEDICTIYQSFVKEQ